jgi:hypothetical protein
MCNTGIWTVLRPPPKLPIPLPLKPLHRPPPHNPHPRPSLFPPMPFIWRTSGHAFAICNPITIPTYQVVQILFCRIVSALIIRLGSLIMSKRFSYGVARISSMIELVLLKLDTVSYLMCLPGSCSMLNAKLFMFFLLFILPLLLIISNTTLWKIILK